MFGGRPKFIKPAQDPLYPSRTEAGIAIINPQIDSSLIKDDDSKSDFVYNRHHHLPVNAQRQKLPVFEYRNHILYLLEKYQTLILVGETGCGKSTQVPQYVYEQGHTVCVTQPRVTSSVTLASHVASQVGCELGNAVGYAAGAVALHSSDTKLKFVTEGVLLREMFASPLLMQYSCIMLDEVHERSLMTDVLMGLLKKIAKKRKNLKIIVSSATMDAEFLKDFFNLNSKTKDNSTSTSVILSVQGRVHPIELFYVEEPVADYVKATVDTVIKIHENEPFGDILAFLTSQEEILSALETLQIYSEENNKKNQYRKHFATGILASDLTVLPMYGSLPIYRQIKVFQMADKNVRKVILATNIAETSVTIPGIVYVIDCGFHKLPYFDTDVGIDNLCVHAISKNNAIQRAGRAGRVSKGKCYRLYTEEQYEKLPQSVPPEMCRSDLSTVLLQLKALGINNLLRFTFPTSPPAKSLLLGIEALCALQAINYSGGLNEDIGRYIAELPMKCTLATCLVRSGEFGCLDEMLSIVSMLQVDNVFVKSNTGKINMAAKISRRNNFEVAEGDIIMHLNIYDSYNRIKRLYSDERSMKRACKDWCKKMYINYNVIEKACEIRDSLEKLVKRRFNIENKEFDGTDLGSAKLERIMKSVLTGLFPQAAYLHIDGSYRGIKGAILYISPDSCLYNLQQPKWVIFANVQTNGDKTYMRDLMTIQKNWLLEIAPHYYTEN